MKKQLGLTLIELMVTLAVFALIVGIAVPGIMGFSRSNKLVSETNALVGALNYARSEATKRRANISVCPSDDRSSCNGGWNSGWIVFINDDNDDPAQVDDGEEILRIYSNTSRGNTVNASAALASSITYRANGFSSAMGDIILCDDRGDESARAISISRTGRLSLTTGGGTCTPA